MGLVSDQETAEKQIETYLLMLDDAIVLNINSVRDNDRLTMVTVQQLTSYLKSRPAQAPFCDKKQPQTRAFQPDDKSTQEDQNCDDLDLVVEVDGGNDASPEETKKQYDEQLQKMIELERLRSQKENAVSEKAD